MYIHKRLDGTRPSPAFCNGVRIAKISLRITPQFCYRSTRNDPHQYFMSSHRPENGPTASYKISHEYGCQLSSKVTDLDRASALEKL